MAIEVITPTDAAASPHHPNHARWVREKMLARRMAWLQSVGIEANQRHEEGVIDAGMQRLEARKRNAKPVYRTATAAPPRDPTLNVAHELAQRDGYKFRQRDAGRIKDEKNRKNAARALARASHDFECGICNKCERCKREIRCKNILRFGRAADSRLRPLALLIISAGLAAHGKVGKFRGLSKTDVDKELTRILEKVCDASVPIVGAWR